MFPMVYWQTIQQIPPPSASLRVRNDKQKGTKLYTNVPSALVAGVESAPIFGA
jgi:hypothetical protein